MFEKRPIANRHTLRLSAVADSADTTINVNNGGGRTPPRPEFSSRQRSTYTTPGTSAHAGGGTTIETHKQLNWGSVVKGAAVVAGVALVAVVAFYAVPAALTSLGVIGPGGVLTGLVEAATPAATAVGNHLMLGVNFLDDLIAQSLLNISNAVGLSGAVSSVTGAVSSASAATVAAVQTVTGGIAATATMAAGIPLAMKSIATMPFTDTVHVAQHTTPATTGLEDGGASVVHTKKSAYAATQQASMADLPDLPDAHVLHDQAASMKAASKVAHHAAHAVDSSGHDGGADMDVEPDAPEQRTRNALNRSEHASKAWAERVGTREKHAITPRSSEFATQVAEDRAKLDAALAERA